MRFGVDRPVPVAEMSGLCSFCPGGLKVGETEQIGEQPFPLLIDAGDSQNVADGVLVFHLSEKKMLEGVAAIEKTGCCHRKLRKSQEEKDLSGIIAGSCGFLHRKTV